MLRCIRRCVNYAQLGAAVIASTLMVAGVASADSSICDSVFVGDLNGDKKVTIADFTVFAELRNAGGYSTCADFTRDGVLNDADGTVLAKLVEFNTSQINGGNQFRVPNITLNELRLGVPSTSTPLQQRYIELRIPQDQFPTNYSWNGTLPEGYTIVLIGRSTTDQGITDQGVVLRTIDLTGLEFQRDGLSAGYALILQEQPVPGPTVFNLPTPNIPKMRTPDLDLTAPSSIPIGDIASRNITVLLTYRRPASIVPPYEPVATLPSPGSDLDTGDGCRLATRATVGTVGPPPWDVIIDAVSLRRSPTNIDSFGCNYCPLDTYGVGPIDADDSAGTDLKCPLHGWRCEALPGNADEGMWRALSQQPAFGVDTPGRLNRNCAATTPFCGESDAGNCAAAHTTAACNDAACCSAVCEIDPNCCVAAWDTGCVTHAATVCFECGGAGAGDCFAESDLPYCDDSACCELVCAADATCCVNSWDSTCVARARQDCLSCGDTVGTCFVEHTLPYCDNAECCETVCASEPSCCTQSWDAVCVELAIAECEALGCGSPNAGECCLSHSTPYCNDATCCDLVCAADPFCCEARWDLACAFLALEGCSSITCVCGDPVSPDCFTVHGAPGCSNQACCDTVCVYDTFCCVVSWDAACVGGADVRCAENPACQGSPFNPVFGSCYLPHAGTVGCDDPNCCDEVCFLDSRCCNTAWDIDCAKLATVECNGCGDLASGSCFSVHGLPTCSDGVCCEIVCAADSVCCEVTWDFACVELAVGGCSGAVEACGSDTLRSCFVASTAVGCADTKCCELICTTIDPSCCELGWDAICVRMAVQGCDPPAGSEGGDGDCLQVHITRSCANEACAAAVCSVEPSCCQSGWDERCVEIAYGICIAPNTCPGEGSCFDSHQSPGCSDPYCCNVVCGVDPDCCTNRWDGQCATLADNLCEKQEVDWQCPCVGSCFVEHADSPGCDEGSCCAAVCVQIPGCCVDGWDLSCAELARSICCGTIGCDSGCNGSCLIPHETPYCEDPYCCEAVCQIEPFCCEIIWDGFCATLAEERCATSCGSPEAPSCFTDHYTPGCSDFDCCAIVCAKDDYCCNYEWDPKCVDMAVAECDLPTCGDDGLGDCCTIHNGPWCADTQCCTQVCAQDAFCCQVEWDSTCVQLTYEFNSCGCKLECGDPCAYTCCEAHFGPACNDAACCTIVCASDQYCCDVSWDSVCASMAREHCYAEDEACPLLCGAANGGSCCTQHPLGGCNDEACCESVCGIDFYCCQVQWDFTCVELVAAECDPDLCAGESCGSSTAGSCYDEHTNPFCNDFKCCNSVCSYDESCCITAWDAACVELAQALCTAFQGDGPTSPPPGEKPNQFKPATRPDRGVPPAGKPRDPRGIRGPLPAGTKPLLPAAPKGASVKPSK